MNLLSNDVGQFKNFGGLHSLWAAPSMAVIATYMLWIEMQWAGIFGVVTILVFATVQSMFLYFLT